MTIKATVMQIEKAHLKNYCSKTRAAMNMEISIFKLKGSYIYYYKICITVPLREV